MRPKPTNATEKERARQRASYHKHKDKWQGRDVAKGFDAFWAKRGGRPAHA